MSYSVYTIDVTGKCCIKRLPLTILCTPCAGVLSFVNASPVFKHKHLRLSDCVWVPMHAVVVIYLRRYFPVFTERSLECDINDTLL